MLSFIIVAAIVVSVILGYRTKINTGLFCIGFAYIIGCFGMGITTKSLITMWPTSIMFVILAVSLFYNFAAINGTLEKMSGSLLYACRKFPGLLPFALLFVAVALSIMGAAYFTVLAFLAPMTMLICDEANMDKLTGAVAINCGALAGGNFPTAALGVIFRGLIDSSYEGADMVPLDSFYAELIIFGLSVLFSVALVAVFRYGFKGNNKIGQGITFQKPEPLNGQQKTTLTLMLAMMAVVLIFPLLKLLMPTNELVSLVSGKIDVGLVAILFAIIAFLLDLAPQKQVIAMVPWNTIIMIAGAGILIAVAVEAGTVNLMAQWIGGNVPVLLIPLAFSFVGAFMGFFSSTTGVVAPALFPLIPTLSAAMGIDPVVLFTCTVLGAQSSAISPFSSGGSLILGSCNKEEERTELFNRLMFVGVPTSVALCGVYNLILAFVL